MELKKKLGEGWLAGGVACLLLVGLIFWTAFSTSYSKAYHDAYEDAYRVSAQHNKYDAAENECRSSITSSEAVDCLKKAEKAERERKNSEQDLEAQRQMADWAWWMMWATIFTAFVTAFGVILIAVTLIATRQTVDIMRAEQRPWINFDVLEVMLGRDDARQLTLTIYANVSNVGKTPAQRVSLNFEIFQGSLSPTERADFISRQAQTTAMQPYANAVFSGSEEPKNRIEKFVDHGIDVASGAYGAKVAVSYFSTEISRPHITYIVLLFWLTDRSLQGIEDFQSFSVEFATQGKLPL